MDISSGYAGVQGGQLYYESAGAGPPVIFIHGFGLDLRMWYAQFPVFAQKYRVIGYDLLGFGRSSVPADVTYTHYDNLSALLDHLNIPAAHIIGLSMGGRVAHEFAITYPRRTLSLVLVDSGLNGYKNIQALFRDIFTQAAAIGAIAANRLWLAHRLFAPAMQQPRVAAQLEAMVDAYSGWHWVSRDPVQWLDPPAMHQLHKIQAKTLVLAGEEDLADYHEAAEIFTRDIPGATKRMIPGAGHMSSMEAPDVFNKMVLDFLAEVICGSR